MQALFQLSYSPMSSGFCPLLGALTGTKREREHGERVRPNAGFHHPGSLAKVAYYFRPRPLWFEIVMAPMGSFECTKHCSSSQCCKSVTRVLHLLQSAASNEYPTTKPKDVPHEWVGIVRKTLTSAQHTGDFPANCIGPLSGDVCLGEPPCIRRLQNWSNLG
jgi:hypothetical protein